MKIRYYIAILICTVLFSSCKDWLDVYPKSEITADKVFESEDGFYSALAGLYVKMSDEKFYGFDMTSGYIEMMGNTVFFGAGNNVTYFANNFYNDPANGPFVRALLFPAYNYTRGKIRTTFVDDTFTDMWKAAYGTIANANELLAQLDKVESGMFESGIKELLTGEVLAIRAYIHLDMVRLFQVPYLSDKAKTDKRIPYMENMDGLQFVPSSTIDEMLDKVDADLIKAAAMMKDNDPISSGKSYFANMFRTDRKYKMNYYAVKALQARSYLYRGKTTEAYAAAKEVIDNATRAKAHFVTDAERAEVDGVGAPINRSCPMENLFAVVTEDLDENMQDAIKSNSIRLKVYGRFASNKWLSANTFTGGQPNGFFSSEGDVRLLLWKKTSYPAGMITKYIRESTAPADIAKYPKQAVTLLKLGEAYLIAAEAAIDAVSPSEGLAILNDLQRSRKGGVYNGPIEKEALLDEILNEYRREMLGDGQMFYAYKRRYTKKLPTLYQTPEMVYYFEMTDERYSPDIPDAEYNGGRTY